MGSGALLEGGWTLPPPRLSQEVVQMLAGSAKELRQIDPDIQRSETWLCRGVDTCHSYTSHSRTDLFPQSMRNVDMDLRSSSSLPEVHGLLHLKVKHDQLSPCKRWERSSPGNRRWRRKLQQGLGTTHDQTKRKRRRAEDSAKQSSGPLMTMWPSRRAQRQS